MFKKWGLPVILGAACMVATIIISGNAQEEASGALIDIPGFIITIIVPFLIVLASFGVRATSRAFSTPFDRDSTVQELKLAKAWFGSFLRYVVAFSIFAFSTGFVGIMVFAAGQDSTIVGKNFAIAILSIFYAAAFSILLILPFQQAIDMRLAEKE